MTIEYLPDTLALLAGCGLGVVFYGGLWWTIRRGLGSNNPSVWFVGSMLVRIVSISAGFVVVSGGHWQRSLACLIGFVIAREFVTRWTGQPRALQIFSIPKANDAP